MKQNRGPQSVYSFVVKVVFASLKETSLPMVAKVLKTLALLAYVQLMNKL